jgi:hypothetical protein
MVSCTSRGRRPKLPPGCRRVNEALTFRRLLPARVIFARRFSAVCAALLAGCSGSRVDPPSALTPALSEPLAAFASVPMIALPVQYIRSADSTGWTARLGDPRAFLARLDSALESSLRERGLGAVWAFPTDLARTARRNPVYAADPAIIRAGDAVRSMERRSGSEIPEPVGSQLRTLAGFHDARHALVPAELRFEAVPIGGGGGARAVLRVAVLDVRASRLVWVGEIAGAPAPAFSADVATDLARRFADLIVSR